MGKPITRMIPIFIKELNRYPDCKTSVATLILYRLP